MKKLFLLIPILLLFAIIGCDKEEEVQDVNSEIILLQDSVNVIIDQHNALLDSISKLIATIDKDKLDIKAFKMEQVSSLFASIARQPEAAPSLISATELLYTDYTELLPISDTEILKRGKARGIAFGGLFEAIARQPEAYEFLDQAASKFLGEYNSSYISDELLDITKAYSVADLNESLARQPEALELFNAVCQKYLNFEINTEIIE